MQLLAASANVEARLPGAVAAACVGQLIEHAPDVIGLQEFFATRAPVIGRFGRVRMLPGPLALGRDSAYTWVGSLLGDCVIGVRTDRFTVDDARVPQWSRWGRAENPTRPWGLEPPRRGLLLRVRAGEVPLSVINFHFSPGVQARGAYRPDRPRLVARHREETRRLEAAVAGERAAGRTVIAMGDSNLDGFRIDGLASAWSERPNGSGTLGRRFVDDIFGPGPAHEVTTLDNASDHRAVLALREI